MTSIRPSDMSAEPAVLDIHNRNELKRVARSTFGDFLSQYLSPSTTERDYFDMRWVPDIWEVCCESTSRSHLFLYTYIFMQGRSELKDWFEARRLAKEQCAEEGNEAGLVWLNRRPMYVLQQVSSGSRCHFPAWNEEVRGWFVTYCRSFRLTARLLLVVYSSKVLLDSGLDLRNWRGSLSREWETWSGWVDGENSKIREFFSLNQS